MAAIVLAMIAGDLMHLFHDRASPEGETRPSGPKHGHWLVHLIPVLAVGATASYLAAIAAPYLQITAWYLNDHKYSILQTVGTLFSDREIVFALAIACFLVLLPGLRIIWIMLAWGVRNRPESLRKVLGGLRLIRRWSMLDVFGLAIGLFLLEGSNLVPIEHRPRSLDDRGRGGRQHAAGSSRGNARVSSSARIEPRRARPGHRRRGPGA